MDLVERDRILENLNNELQNIRGGVRKISKKMGKEGISRSLKKAKNTYKTFCNKKQDGGSERSAMMELSNYLDNSLRATTDEHLKMRIKMAKDRIQIMMNK